MFCTNCGKELKDGTLFCTECGVALSKKEEIPGKTTAPKKNSRLPLILIALVVVIGLVIGGIFLFGGLDSLGNADDEDDERTEQSVDDSEDEDKDTESQVSEVDTETQSTETQATETEEDTETIAMPEDYKDIVAELVAGDYKVIDTTLEKEAEMISAAIMDARFLTDGMAVNMADISDENRGALNYNLVEKFAYDSVYGIPTTQDEVDGTGYGDVYDNHVLEAFFAEVYQGGKLAGGDNGLEIMDNHTVYNAADGDTWYSKYTYLVKETDNYVLFEAPCYEFGNDGSNEYRYNVRILYKKDEGNTFHLQAVYAEAYKNEVSIAEITASSQLADSGEKTYKPSNLIDGNYSTAWVENVAGVGIGESIQIDLGQEQLIHEIVLFNGYLSTYSLYEKNGKVTELTIDFGDGNPVVWCIEPENFGFSDDIEIESVWPNAYALEKPVMTSKITLTITGAEAGTAYEDTCISEMLIH